MSFEYHSLPLQRPEQQIRLLSLHLDDKDDSAISEDILVYDLKDCPPYYAISYAWGDRLPRMTIQVNGMPLKVQHNCWYALWQMRHHRQNSVFWIDQVCIDQDSVYEKNRQVAFMGSIYKSAAMVASCLGSGRTLFTLRYFDSELPETPTQVMDALDVLSKNPYFERMWIKQEVILAREVRLFCGLTWLGWAEFEEVSRASGLTRLRKMKSAHTAHPRSTKGVNTNYVRLMERRKHQQQSSGQPGNPESPPWDTLWQLLAEYGDALCQDPHDKVYALLPLVPETTRSRLNLVVDYDEPLLVLALKLTRNMLVEAMLTGIDGSLSASRWHSVITLVEQWFGLSPVDPAVRRLAAERCAPQELPTLSSAQSLELFKLIDTKFYANMDVWYRYTTTHKEPWETLEPDKPTDPLLDAAYSRDADVHEDYTSFQLRESSLSPSMQAKELPAYLHQYLGEDEEDDVFTEYQGPSSLAALPPDMLVKVVISIFTTTHRMIFLVSPETVVGDQVLICYFSDPANTIGGLLPVVRRWDQEPSWPLSSPIKVQYSFLVGWALQVDNTGRISHKDIHPLDLQTIEAQDDVTFNLHYEDLMLNAMCSREPASLLMQPCMHPKHPSFLVEPFDQPAPSVYEPKKVSWGGVYNFESR